MLIAFALIARPTWDFLAELLAEARPDHGAAVIVFMNERHEEAWLVSLEFNGEERLPRSPPERGGWIVRRPAGLPRDFEIGVRLVSALAGRHDALITYEVGDERVREIFSFQFDLEPLMLCEVRVALRDDGPRSTACQNPRPAAYGGTWPH